MSKLWGLGDRAYRQTDRQVMWCATGSTDIVSFLGYVLEIQFDPICIIDVSVISFLKI